MGVHPTALCCKADLEYQFRQWKLGSADCCFEEQTAPVENWVQVHSQASSEGSSFHTQSSSVHCSFSENIRDSGIIF